MCVCRDSVSWEDVVQHLQRSLEHLDRLAHPAIQRLCDTDDLEEYARSFDLSRSQPQQVNAQRKMNGETLVYSDEVRYFY